MTKRKNKSFFGVLCLVLLLAMSGFLLISFANDAFDSVAIITGAVLCALILVHYYVMVKLLKPCCAELLIIVYVLITIGMIMQYRTNPEVAFKQLMWIAFGMGVCCMMLPIICCKELLKKLNYFFMAFSLLALVATLALGKSSGGAYNWINIAGFSFQPSEFIKIALVFVLACAFSNMRNRAMLIISCLFSMACVILLVISRDLGAAVILTLTTICIFYIATSNLPLTLIGLGGAAVGGVLGYTLFDHVKVRVAAWQNPWATYETSGYQIAQGLMAIASGGLFGLGLYRGTPKIIPAYHTDYIFAIICEEMGMLTGIMIICFYLILILRSFSIALKAPNTYYSLIASGLCIVLGIQTFIILGGIVKLIPLTGVTLPFVSYGGSSIVSSFITIGILLGIERQNNLPNSEV